MTTAYAGLFALLSIATIAAELASVVRLLQKRWRDGTVLAAFALAGGVLSVVVLPALAGLALGYQGAESVHPDTQSWIVEKMQTGPMRYGVAGMLGVPIGAVLGALGLVLGAVNRSKAGSSADGR